MQSYMAAATIYAYGTVPYTYGTVSYAYGTVSYAYGTVPYAYAWDYRTVVPCIYKHELSHMFIKQDALL